MKVCHITTAHPTFDTRIFLKECTSLAKAGYDVSYVVVGGETTTRNRVRVIGVNSEFKSRLARIFIHPFLAFLAAWRLKADVYHFHDPAFLPLGLFLRMTGGKVIYDAHEDLPRQTLAKDYLPQIIRPLLAWVIEIIENFIVARLDGVICATPFIAARFNKTNQNVENINNFPLADEFNAVSVSSWDSKEHAVCYVGAIHEIRGADVMVQAMAEVPVVAGVSVKLYLGGDLKEGSGLFNKLAAMPGWKNVDFKGYVSREQMSEILSKSIAGLVLFLPLPSHIDALPNKLFEYLSAGIPVIASNFSLWRSIIEKNECGICIDPSNPRALSDAICKLLKNPLLAKKMGENGRRLIEQELNWQNEELKLLKYYAQL